MPLNKKNKIFLKNMTIGFWGLWVLLASMLSCDLKIPESFFNEVVSNEIGAPTVSYPVASYSFVKNTAIAAATPAITATPLTNCTATPSLSTIGLSINATSCAISGTPMIVQAATSYTITASNAYGNGTANISIEVTLDGVAPSVSYTGSPFTLTLNTDNCLSQDKICVDPCSSVILWYLK